MNRIRAIKVINIITVSMSLWMGVGFQSLHAATLVDVYGTDEAASKKILQKYGTRVATIMATAIDELTKQKPDETDSLLLIQAREQRDALREEIKRKEGFLYVDFDLTRYPNIKDNYVTIEVVKPSDRDRLQFVDALPAVVKKTKTPDIVDKMTEFQYVSVELLFNNKLSPKQTSCPVYHCFTSADHPMIKPYFKAFNQAAIHQRSLIIHTLKHDPDPTRRASAAFLIGHFQDPHDILQLLLPAVTDPNDAVRNNAIRVIASTLFKSNIRDVDMRPFVRLLNSPYSTDRNKSLYVVETLIDAPKQRQWMMLHGGDNLIALLRLKQPNNHDVAYLILKKLSGHDFGEHQISAWEKWLSQASKAIS